MEDNNLDKSIDQYLSGELSDVEKDAFEKRLDMDTSLKEELAIALKAKVALYAKGIEEQKEGLTLRWEKLQQERKSRTRRLYAFAAAAVISLMILFSVFFPKPKVDSQVLFAQYYETPLASSMRDLDSQSYLKKGNIAFQQKKYEEASQAYIQSLEDTSFINKEEALFYGGISFLELEREDKAIELFEQLSSDSYLPMKDWFITMSYLSLGQLDLVKENLDKILGEPNHFYFQKARDLSEALDL